MGKLLKESFVKAALLGIPDDVAERISDRLRTKTSDDAGRFDVKLYSDIGKCRNAISVNEVTAAFISLRAFAPADLVAFIGDIRVTYPLVSFCLVGTSQDLNQLPGLHSEWKKRFSHYYRIPQDLQGQDFEDNVGLARDLLIADAVKVAGLDANATTPGRMIRIVHKHVGDWTVAVATILVPLVAAVTTLLVSHFFPNGR